MGEKKKILVVDDEEDVIKAFVFRLGLNNYEVITAQDGQEGLNKARSEAPDLIVLDLMLPKMDGYKVCALLKTDNRYRKIPIIIFTARGDKEDEIMAKEAGADAFIMKPFDPHVLLAKIQELLAV